MSTSRGQNSSPYNTRSKIKGVNALKKMHRENKESLLNPPGQDEVKSHGPKVKEASIHDLPPEMLMEVLKCVDTRSLFSLRLVNRNWNLISSRILCKRPDARIWFMVVAENKFIKHKDPCRKSVDEYLEEYLECLKKSKNYRCTHFKFSVYPTADPTQLFDHPHFTQFLSHFKATKSSSSQSLNPNPNPGLLGLEFKFWRLYDDNTMAIFAAKLGDFLLNKTPFVEKLSLEYNFRGSGQNVKLFPPSNQKYAEIRPEPEPRFQLAHLKEIRVLGWTISDQTRIIKELLSAAVKLEKIYVYGTKVDDSHELPMFLGIFDFLQSLGKFHLLKTFEFELNPEFLSTVKTRPDLKDGLLNLELEELVISTWNLNLNAYENSQATTFISLLLESSKNSLEKLEMGPLGILAALKLPTFKNLTQLKLGRPTSCSLNLTFFPPGVRALDIFPAVRDLPNLPDFWYTYLGPLECIPILPNVHNLIVYEEDFSVTSFSKLCPNLKHLRIHKSIFDPAPNLNLLFAAPQIWRLMTQLESLEVDTKIYKNICTEYDSCFTGLLVDKIQLLHQMREAKERLRQGWTPESAAASKLTAERELPSILDMKSLKKLTINPYKLDHIWGKMDKQEFYTKTLTWISQEYAFKLLPNLKLN